MKSYTKTVTTLIAIMLWSVAAIVRAENQADYLGYPVGSTVKIYINWDSFEAQGIPSSWKTPFQDCVINAYTRWVHVGSFKLKPKFYGYTTRTQPASDEIIISMNEKHATSTRLASRFEKPAKIVFHRKSGATNTNWNFTPFRAADGEYDMQGILIHELGHAFGLEHNTNGSSKSAMGGYTFRARFGPYHEDITDIQAQYGAQTNWDVKIKRSTNSGASWSNYSTNLTGLGVATTIDPTAVRDSNRSLFFYTTPSKKPAWIIGSLSPSSFDTSKWWVYGGLRSAYGNAGAGWGNEYMMAWVDDKDSHKVKVVYSSNGGESFSYRNPPSTNSYGTPALHKLADNTWVLTYTKNHTSNKDENGKIAVRISTNDGSSWGEETILNSYYRAENGLSITSNGTSDVRIGFSWSRKSNQSSGINYLKRTIRAHLSGGSLIYDGMIYESEGTRTHPVFAKNSSRMLQAWREPNFNTSINTRFSTIGSTSWDNYVRVVESSPVTPTIGAYKNYSYAFLYYMDE